MFKFILIASLALASCSGRQHTPAQTTRITIEAAAHGLAVVDTAVSQAISRDSRQPHPPGAVHDKWHGTVEALEHARSDLVLAERAVDTYTTAHDSACPAYVAVLAVKGSTGELTDALHAVGITIPEAFNATLFMLLTAAQSLAPQCPDGGVL